MKAMTKHLAGFAATALILTISVRALLSFLLETRQFALTYVIAGIYAICMFVAGWLFGEKESQYLPIYDIGFRYNLSTFLIFNGISELWFTLGFNSDYERISSVHFTVILWGAIVLIHYFFFLRYRKKSINGLNKEDLFE